MRQISEEFLMNRRVDDNGVTPEMVDALSEKLVHLYSSAETDPYPRIRG